MKSEWMLLCEENGVPTKEFVEIKTVVNPITGQSYKCSGNIKIPLEVWEKMVSDNKQVEAIDVEWKELEPTTAAREEEYNKKYSWLLLRFERTI